MVKVIFSNTYDLDAYFFAFVTEEEFERLEALRGEHMWTWIGEENEHGYIDTYHGKAED